MMKSQHKFFNLPFYVRIQNEEEDDDDEKNEIKKISGKNKRCI